MAFIDSSLIEPYTEKLGIPPKPSPPTDFPTGWEGHYEGQGDPREWVWVWDKTPSSDGDGDGGDGGGWEDWPRYDFPVPTSITGGALAGVPTIPKQAPFDWLAEAEKLRKIEQVRGTIARLQEGLGPIRTSLQSMLELSPEALEKRYQAEIQTPAQRYFGEQTLPSLRRSFVGPGTFWSSMRAGAEQRAGERLSEALMGQRSRMIGEAQQRALSASGLAMQLEQQAFGGGMYPWETALKAAPIQLQARGQDLQRELAEAQNIMGGRAQDLGYWAERETLGQRERELWGYLNPETYSPTGTPISASVPYQEQTQAASLGAAL